MEAPLDHGPTGTEEVEPEIIQTLHGWSTSGAPPGPDVAETGPMEDQQPSLHDPSSSPTNGPDSGLTDLDCPICFSRYDNSRVPKELSCKHSFCVVCLKLLIYNEVGTWRIVCPICRALTPVFGGLVCTLQNQESLMRRLESPKPKVEVLQPQEVVLRLDVDIAGHSQCDPRDDERHGNLRMAARRLVILLLILLIILIIIMQFLYTGIMKWVLGFTLGIVVIITVLLCFNPNCRMSVPRAANQQNGQ